MGSRLYMIECYIFRPHSWSIQSRFLRISVKKIQLFQQFRGKFRQLIQVYQADVFAEEIAAWLEESGTVLSEIRKFNEPADP